MASIQFMSDLHLEFEDKLQRKQAPSAFKIPKTDADVIVLAGDVGNRHRGIDFAYKTSTELKTPVIYVVGNHEYWGSTFQTYIEKLRIHEESLKTQFSNAEVYLLNNSSVVIKSVKFIGCTLWTDLGGSGNYAHVASQLNDYRKIKFEWSDGKYKKVKPSQIAARHERDRKWLEDELKSGADVVVTHHPPHPHCVPPEHRGTSLSHGYFTDLSELMKSDSAPKLWISGHTHYAADFVVGKTRIVSNPRGYPGETQYCEKSRNKLDPLRCHAEVTDRFRRPCIRRQCLKKRPFPNDSQRPYCGVHAVLAESGLVTDYQSAKPELPADTPLPGDELTLDQINDFIAQNAVERAKDISKLKQAISKQQNRIDQLRKQYFGAGFDEFEKQRLDLTKEIEGRVARQHNLELNFEKKRTQDVEEELSRSELEVSELKKQMLALQTKASDAEKAVAQLKEQLASKEQELAVKQHEAEAVMRWIESKAPLLKQLEQELEEDDIKLERTEDEEEQSSELSARRASLQQQMDEKLAQLKVLMAEIPSKHERRTRRR